MLHPPPPFQSLFEASWETLTACVMSLTGGTSWPVNTIYDLINQLKNKYSTTSCLMLLKYFHKSAYILWLTSLICWANQFFRVSLPFFLHILQLDWSRGNKTLHFTLHFPKNAAWWHQNLVVKKCESTLYISSFIIVQYNIFLYLSLHCSSWELAGFGVMWCEGETDFSTPSV